MERINYHYWLTVLAAAGGIAWTGSACADAADALNFTVSQSVTRDDNIFRLSADADAQALIGSAERGDTFLNTHAGVQFDKLIGRQRLRAALNASRTRYDRFSRLNFDGKDINAGWNWEMGNRWRGEIAWSRNETLTNFSDLRSLVKNVNTSENRSFSANYQFHPDWLIGATAARALSGNSSLEQQTSSNETDTAEAVLQYVSGSQSSVALRLRRTDGRFPNGEVSAGRSIDNSYRQDDVEASATWHPSGVSRLDARLARVRRSYDDVPARAFSGATGQLAWAWTITGKTALNVTARREIGAGGSAGTSGILSSYTVTRTFSVSPTWMPTAKTSLQAAMERQVSSFQGDPVTIVSGGGQREDQLRVVSLSASYIPTTSLRFSASLRREQRESNTAGFSYRANVAFTSAQFSF